VIRDEFREQPADTDVAAGDVAVLHCKPPRGDPDPKVRWMKDGSFLVVSLDERLVVTNDGTLQVRNVRRNDTGLYSCLAVNVGGQRESKTARLVVMGTL